MGAVEEAVDDHIVALEGAVVSAVTELALAVAGPTSAEATVVMGAGDGSELYYL